MEHESFREVLRQREEVKNQFNRQEKTLRDRKEKLMKQKDLTRWGFQGPMDELNGKYEQLLSNKPAAFTFMLQKETADLEAHREELAFFTNQCLEETRRVGRENGKLLIDHFIQMSQTQCSYINQTHVMWADFLSHFQELAEEEREGE